MVNMPAQISVNSNGLRIDAWLKSAGTGIFGGRSVNYSETGDIHVRLTERPGTSVPEPLSASLLAAGLLGSGVLKRGRAVSH